MCVELIPATDFELFGLNLDLFSLKRKRFIKDELKLDPDQIYTRGSGLKKIPFSGCATDRVPSKFSSDIKGHGVQENSKKLGVAIRHFHFTSLEVKK